MQQRLWHSALGVLTLLLVGYGSLGCTDGVSGVRDTTPVHLHLVCPAPGEAPAARAQDADSLAAVQAWVRSDTLFRPQSTVTVWAVGPHRQGAQPQFTACVPPAWGPDVMHAKARFLTAVQAGARGCQTGPAGGGGVPSGCLPPGPHTPGRHQLVVAAALAPLRPDQWDTMVAPPGTPSPLHLAIVCDRSDSTLGMACTTPGVLGAFDRWLADSFATPGASLAVYVVGSSRDTVRRVYTLIIPEGSVGKRVAVLLGARRELLTLLPERPEPNASAVAEALSVAVSALRERAGRFRLVVLSDLRQVTPRTWNFEQAVPPPPQFITWLKKTQQFVDLRDIPVRVCGLHHQRGPGARPSAAALLTQLRATWDGTFKAMGASDVELFTTCEVALASR